MKLTLQLARSSAVLFLCSPAFSQPSTADSVVTIRDTIVVIGTRSSILSPENAKYQEELFSSPGGFHDPLRAVSLLPQTAITSDLQAQPTIGGDDPDRILTLLDGFEIIAPYRFLGAFSVFNPLMTRSVNATATGYPVRYGGFFPSAVEVRTDNDYVKNTFVAAEFTLPISQLVVGVPIQESTGLSARLGMRASHLSVIRPVLSAFTKDKNFEAFLPHLRDVQWGITFSPSETFSLRQTGIVADENGSLESFERTFSYSWKKMFQGLTLDWQPRQHWNLTTRISLHNNDANLRSIFPLESLGDQTFAMHSVFRQVKISSEAVVNPGEKARVSFGADLSHKKSEQSFFVSSEYLRVPLPASTTFNDAAFFVEPYVFLWDRLEITFGERLWYSEFIRAGGNESRVNVGLRLLESTRVEAGFGEYSQPPSDVQVLHGYLSLLAQPNQPPRLLLMSESKTALAPEESEVLFARVHHTFLALESLSGMVSTELYGKNESNIILSQRYPSVFTPIDSNSFQPSQRFKGNKWGMGISLLLSDALSGITASASYARQSSMITDMTSGSEIPAGSDRHNLFKAMIRFGKEDWNISATYQYYSGPPTTDRYFLQSTGIFGDSFFVPVWKNLNTGRLPSYKRLDFFISKTFDVGSWMLTPYCDIVNVLNSKNVSNFDYTLNETNPPEYTNKNPVYNSLPLFPMVGVRLKKEW